MKFRELPRKLQLFILAQAAPLAVLLLAVPEWPQQESLPLFLVLLAATAVFATWRVELTVLQGKMTLVFAAVCLALLLLGEGAAVICSVFGALVGLSLKPQASGWRVRWVRVPLYKYWFNFASCAVACAASALVYSQVSLLPVESSVRGVLGVVSFTCSYFLLNTFSISTAIALQQALRPFEVWQENFLWTAPGFFASASAAAAIKLAFAALSAWSLLLLAPLYVVYYSYRLYLERIRKDMDHITELNRLNEAVILSLATAIDAKDQCTCSHIHRVQQYAIALGKACGLSDVEMQAVRTGALVHDIGKLGIPDHILGKPGKLTPEEYRRMQTHVYIGAEILGPVPFPFPVVDVVMTHHERWDGLGYPRGLKGEQIPIGGRIISIVDVFDALTSNRPYRRALSVDAAVQVLRESAGRQFDPRLVELFIQVLPGTRAIIEQFESEEQSRRAMAAAAEEGPRALDYIGQAAAEMAAVCDVAQVLAQETTEEQALEVVVARALMLVPADTAVLYLATPGHELRAAAAEGCYADRLRGMVVHRGEGVAGTVAATQQPLLDVSASPDVARRFSPEEDIELTAATAVPLLHGPEQLGVLAVYTMRYGTLSPHHVNVLNILAEHAAATLHQLRRLELNREMAVTDTLTGLPNSRALHTALQERLREPGAGEPFGLVMLDLDGFKRVNDTLGHLAGDELLRRVAGTLLASVRRTDLVCRYAGDEFVIMVPGADAELLARTRERVRAAVDALCPVEGRVAIGASLGTALYPADGGTATELLHAADQRMYEDKFNRKTRQEAEPGVPVAGRAD